MSTLSDEIERITGRRPDTDAEERELAAQLMTNLEGEPNLLHAAKLEMLRRVRDSGTVEISLDAARAYQILCEAEATRMRGPF